AFGHLHDADRPAGSPAFRLQLDSHVVLALCPADDGLAIELVHHVFIAPPSAVELHDLVDGQGRVETTDPHVQAVVLHVPADQLAAAVRRQYHLWPGCGKRGCKGAPNDGRKGKEDRLHGVPGQDRKSTRLNSSHVKISYAVFCLKKKKTKPR